MTKAIEDTLNLSSMKDFINHDDDSDNIQYKIDEENQIVESTTLDESVDIHEKEMNKIMSSALKAHDELMELGMNMEPKNAGANAFAPSAKFLEIALKASQSKTEQRMNQIKLILEKDKNRKESFDNLEIGELDEKDSVVALRSDIMNKIAKGEI